ncbi:MAG TPA: PEP-CTERM sorting domain-containing protein [Rhodocyclaceae bacterium]|nr:PEP-CTERM sorting domain-containing protein [Rhodocyclaceae bacterium]
MLTRKVLQATLASLLVSAGAQAATTSFSSAAAFSTASGSGLAFESFETATLSTSTSVAFSGGTFSCSGSSYCPDFFGISSLGADAGTKSVYFASPDIATITFDAPVNAFGIHIGGAGDVAPITLTAYLGNGDSAVALDDYTGSDKVFGTNNQFFGVISDTAFSSIIFKASNFGDGIFFDSLSYGTVAAVPEPETYAMMMAGLSLLGLAGRRKSRQSA